MGFLGLKVWWRMIEGVDDLKASIILETPPRFICFASNCILLDQSYFVFSSIFKFPILASDVQPKKNVHLGGEILNPDLWHIICISNGFTFVRLDSMALRRILKSVWTKLTLPIEGGFHSNISASITWFVNGWTSIWQFLVSKSIFKKNSYAIFIPNPFLWIKIWSKWILNRYLKWRALNATPLSMSIPVAPYGRVKIESVRKFLFNIFQTF